VLSYFVRLPITIEAAPREGIREELLGLFISFSLTSIAIDGILRMVDGCLKLRFGPRHTNLWAISRSVGVLLFQASSTTSLRFHVRSGRVYLRA
jgi:hypothetical protein